MKPIEKVLIAGRGAVGLTFGNVLAKAMPAGNFAFLCDEKRRQRYEQDPVRINNQPQDFCYVSSPEDFGKADLILFCTKYMGLKDAMEEAAGFVGEDTILISGINGIVSEDDLKARFPNNQVIRAIAQKMDSRYGNNAMNYSQVGELVVGMEDPSQKEDFERLLSFFDQTGFPYVLSDDIVKAQYVKLMANCAINEICAAYTKTYGDLVNDPEYLRMFVDTMEEVRQCAASRGVLLTEEDKMGWVEATKKLDPNSMPSMAQDAMARRPMETELFGKTVIPWGKAAGIPVDHLEDLVRRLDEMEANWKCEQA